MREHSITFFIINTLLVLSMVVNSPLKQSESAYTNTPTHVKANVSTDFSDVKLNADTVNLTILHINDWHGWLEPHDGFGGAATYMGYFKQEGYSSDNDSFLLLSGGDQNTGGAVATLTKGEAMIDVMNTMNFSAAAIGNHEFDDGIDWMNYRQNMADFPILSCNIYDEGTFNLADFAIPWVIQEHAGVQVGIVGLTVITSFPQYDFGDYEEALRNNIPDMRAAGAEIIVALTHVEPDPLISLAANVTDLNIDVFLGGHAGTPLVTKVGDSIIAMAGHYASQYARIDLEVNLTSMPSSVINSSGFLVDNIEGGVTPDAEVQQVVDYWVTLTGTDEVISYSSTNLYDTTPESAIGNLVADGMMNYYGWTHDFAVTNRGVGIRDYFRAGNITLGDVVSVYPLDHIMLELSMTGAELIDLIISAHGIIAFSGIRYNFSNDPSFHITSVMALTIGGYENIVLANVYTGLMVDWLWRLFYKDIIPATVTGIMCRDATIDYFRNISDISLVAYDGRIQEVDDTFVPEFSRTHLLFLTLSSSFMLVIFFFLRGMRIYSKYQIKRRSRAYYDRR
ncbi:MAG: bifunctional metallophosphatase/5'-nucleotidase [Candidatus Heimdallarchaeota archaeon]|nr:bifunctional metallophosphatase/5'-nucleotidase [Candidatus Heimdallarchaeota archaeon]